MELLFNVGDIVQIKAYKKQKKIGIITKIDKIKYPGFETYHYILDNNNECYYIASQLKKM